MQNRGLTAIFSQFCVEWDSLASSGSCASPSLLEAALSCVSGSLVRAVLLSFRGYFGDTAGACVRAVGKLGLGTPARGRSGVKTHRPAQNSDFWPEPARLPEKPNGDAWLGGGVLKWGHPTRAGRTSLLGAFSGSWRAFLTHAADHLPPDATRIDARSSVLARLLPVASPNSGQTKGHAFEPQLDSRRGLPFHSRLVVKRAGAPPVSRSSSCGRRLRCRAGYPAFSLPSSAARRASQSTLPPSTSRRLP